MKYTLSGAICYKRCVEIEGKMRYNVGNMFDDVGKMRNDARRLSYNVGKDGTTTWENCWKNAQHFWRNTACIAVGIQKMPPKRGHVFMISLERRRSCSAYQALDVRISQTGCSEFEHNALSIAGAERLGV